MLLLSGWMLSYKNARIMPVNTHYPTLGTLTSGVDVVILTERKIMEDCICSVCKEKCDILCASPMKIPNFWYCIECRAKVVQNKDSKIEYHISFIIQ